MNIKEIRKIMGQVKRYVEAECEGDWTVLDPDDLELFKIVSVSGSFGCDVVSTP